MEIRFSFIASLSNAALIVTALLCLMPTSAIPVLIEVRPNSSEPQLGNQQQQPETQQLDKCAIWSCRKRARRSEIEQANGAKVCGCDQNCALYDDCCRDAPKAVGFGRRLELGSASLRRKRSQWHCHKLNQAFGAILIKASCSPDWLATREDKVGAREVQRRCEHVKDRGKQNEEQESDPGKADPLGMLMPITDLISGITYANSYCLRCNKLPTIKTQENTQPKQERIIYWSPLLECNYNPESDDRNTLYDLISANKGQVLQYSSARKKWVIKAKAINQTAPISDVGEERSCSIQPTPPDSAEHLLRHCHPNTIDRCPSRELEVHNAGEANELQSAQLECEFGHQAISFSETSDDVYFNPGCAKCNDEHTFTCKKLPKKPKATYGVMSIGEDQDETTPGSDAARSGVIHSAKPMTFSFSVLLDIYGPSEAQIGIVHKCPDGHFFDPFKMFCRDEICGLESKLVGDKCVATKAPTRGDLVDKFKPAMTYVTTVGLSISIASLAMYLLLYCLSMLDLRPLVVEMARQRQQLSGNPLDKSRASRCSGDLTNLSAKSQSLSSRGVACLASSLLAAYLLFIAGHQSRTNSAPEAQEIALSCLLIAIATYYCFLVAFNWMFLLSYDIWRTLRLATCQLRSPAMHSQSRRFLSYSLFAIIVSAIIVGLSVAFDQLPLACQTGENRQVGQNCSQLESEIAHFALIYKPKFGQRAGSCWFSNRRSLALFFGFPVAIIMLANLLFFLHSSFMVLKTSSRSSKISNHKHAGNNSTSNQVTSERRRGNCSPKLISVVSRVDSNSSSNSNSIDSGCNQDYAMQNSLTTNSLISVQTIQSHLSASPEEICSPGEESPPPRDGAASREQEEAPKRQHEQKGRKLEQSKSQSSLTNQSVGGLSMSASLALKYDSHLQSIGSVMGSILKDYGLYCRLSTIMGLTWLTGLMASVVDQSDTLWYLFVVLNTLQGLFIFIAFGCKRSKLANLEILIAYLRFRWHQKCSHWIAKDKDNCKAKDIESDAIISNTNKANSGNAQEDCKVGENKTSH